MSDDLGPLGRDRPYDPPGGRLNGRDGSGRDWRDGARFDPDEPPRRRRRGGLGFFRTLVLLGLIGFGLYFAAGPYLAFRALKAAAEAQDVQALNELVDYGAVRGALRPQLRAEAPAPPPSILENPLEAMRRALEPVTPQPQSDPYLTPAGLSDLTRGRLPGDPAAERPAPLPRLRYWDPGRARIAVAATGPRGGDVVFTFQRRRGLFAWRLVHMQLP